MNKKIYLGLSVAILLVPFLSRNTDFNSGLKATVGSATVQDLNNLAEPGPVIFGSSSDDEKPELPARHLLGTDTASRPPLKMGTNPDTYTPRWLDTKQDLGENNLEGLKNLFDEHSNFDEIKQDEPKLTDEEMLEGLAELFKEEPKIAEEPAFDTSVSDYLEKLDEQIEGLNKDLEELLSYKALNKLSEKYPLIIDSYEFKEKDENYSDIRTMHPGFGSAPDTGEIRPIVDQPLVSSMTVEQ